MINRSIHACSNFLVRLVDTGNACWHTTDQIGQGPSVTVLDFTFLAQNEVDNVLISILVSIYCMPLYLCVCLPIPLSESLQESNEVIYSYAHGQILVHKR